VGTRRSDKDVASHRYLVEAIDREVDLRRGFVASRTLGLTTKASILVASASLITALQASKIHSPWLDVAMALSAVAAILGVIVLLPRVGREVPIMDTETNLWDQTDVKALRGLTLAKVEILDHDEHALFWRAVVLAVGFGALGLSLVVAVLVLALVLPN
jgi:hypothetical protein